LLKKSKSGLLILRIFTTSSMLVRDIMVTDYVVLTPTQSWREAAALLLAHQASAGPVIDTAGELIGILSEKDLFRGIFPSHREWASDPHAYLDFEEMESNAHEASEKRVADVMSRRLITATPSMPILKVGALMSASGIHHVPVTDAGRLVGLVNRGGIYRAILGRHLGITKG
jgi:CBS domain-containing protein